MALRTAGTDGVMTWMDGASEEARRFGYTCVWNVVLAAEVLRPEEKVLYCLLRYCAHQSTFAYPGIEWLSMKMGKRRTTVVRAGRRLEEVGLVRIRRRGRGKTNQFELLPLTAEVVDALRAKALIQLPRTGSDGG